MSTRFVLYACALLALAGCSRSCGSSVRPDARQAAPDAGTARPRTGATAPTVDQLRAAFERRIRAQLGTAAAPAPTAARPRLGVAAGSVPGYPATPSSNRAVMKFFNRFPGFCTASFVRAPGQTDNNAWVVVTAAHCVDIFGDRGPFHVEGEDAAGVAFTRQISSCDHPANGPFAFFCADVAVCYLTQRVPNASFVRLPPPSTDGSGDGLRVGQPYELSVTGFSSGTRETTRVGPLRWGRLLTAYGDVPPGDPNYDADNGVSFWPLQDFLCPPPNQQDSNVRQIGYETSQSGTQSGTFGGPRGGDSGGPLIYGDMLVSVVSVSQTVERNTFDAAQRPQPCCGPTCADDATCLVDNVVNTSVCGLRALCPDEIDNMFFPTGGHVVNCLGNNQCTYTPTTEMGARVSYYRAAIDAFIAAQTPPS